MERLRVEINIIPQDQIHMVLVEAPSAMHVFSEPMVKDYTYAKSDYLIP